MTASAQTPLPHLVIAKATIMPSTTAPTDSHIAERFKVEAGQ
jgi:hypothetical protein